VRPCLHGCCCVRVSAAACDRGVRAAAACDRGVRASEGTFERTQVRSNVRWQLLFFKSFLALANHVSTQCPAQHKIPKTLEND
jgi:hypothetical protein